MSGWGTIYNNASYSLGTYSQALLRLQEQVSSGQRIIRASDAPSDASRILDFHAQSKSLDSYLSNIDDVRRNLENASDVLQGVSDMLGRARELVAQASSGTYSADNRKPAAGEINAILDQLVSLANTRSLGRYIFSGAATTTAPFEAQRVDGEIVSVSYSGSNDELAVPVSLGVRYSGTLVGTRVFQANEPQQPAFSGKLGASAGTGTSNVRGDVELIIRHTSTSLGDPLSTGIVAGTGSTNDTVIGDHTVTIDADAGTIQLDGGEAVDYTDPGISLDNVRLTSPGGAVVHLDLTGMSISGTATLDVHGEGVISIDGGASETPIVFNENQAVTDSATGRTLYVNTTAVHRAGEELVSVPGTHNVFDVLIQARDTLRNSEGWSEADQLERLGHVGDVLVEISSQVTQNLTTTGGRLQALGSLETMIENMSNSARDQTAELQDADIVQVATQLAYTQTLYEMTLMTTNKLLSLSLLDFLR
jgi:flagellar hook-associated protein 3 FlgL